ncbi:hypothetical protein KUTeg_017194 [Tegillarca granosa]|uniref:Uncharacterized protein n=1 Tax=Tegillarca granosa TaxID=220873 RepID=A0ABQ9EN00_TEGGR|nr:hypothetical protein KUTeg_017194 [Tegillarca granosa]
MVCMHYHLEVYLSHFHPESMSSADSVLSRDQSPSPFSEDRKSPTTKSVYLFIFTSFCETCYSECVVFLYF